jgi:hypothetical protein
VDNGSLGGDLNAVDGLHVDLLLVDDGLDVVLLVDDLRVLGHHVLLDDRRLVHHALVPVDQRRLAQLLGHQPLLVLVDHTSAGAQQSLVGSVVRHDFLLL